ncbi:MAG: PIN domain-containing protein [Spirochaetales bacterium]|nr:PIN domain-containing protein [Spirochaetales bacterium]MCF7939744.1 PIN domain-containing protein [Spirochaetales bacterium]
MSVDFLDTNLFIYLFDEQAVEKRRTAERLIFQAIEEQNSVISFQVVQETLNVITTKMEVPAASEDARLFFDTVLSSLWKVQPNPRIYRYALYIQSRFCYGFYDSLIISSAIEAGCKRILTEDMNDGQIIDGVKIENPFPD